MDIAERLYVALVHASAAMRASDAELGLSPSRSSTLATLRYAGPLRLGELARREGVSQPTMTQAVQAMEAAGLVDGHRPRATVEGASWRSRRPAGPWSGGPGRARSPGCGPPSTAPAATPRDALLAAVEALDATA